MFLIEILEVYATPWSVYVLGVFECLVVVWVYKFKVIQSNIWLMIGKHPGKWYYIMWGVLIPLLLVVSTIGTYTHTHVHTYTYRQILV